MTRRYKDSGFWERTAPSRSPAGSLAKAAAIYHNREVRQWLARRRGLPQLQRYDIMSQHFRGVMEMLPVELRAVMDIVLSSYNQGMTPKQIAQRRFKSQQSVSSGLHRLRKAGLVKCRKEGRESWYYVDDEDFVGVAAIQWDSRFRKFLEKNRGREQENLVTEFIKEVTE